MARWCEELGYKRFWVSEHHAFPSVAGSAPEVLLAAIGAATQHIRIGSGGIMLPHYSAYKVAEVFSLLANLYPGRVDRYNTSIMAPLGTRFEAFRNYLKCHETAHVSHSQRGPLRKYSLPCR